MSERTPEKHLDTSHTESEDQATWNPKTIFPPKPDGSPAREPTPVLGKRPHVSVFQEKAESQDPWDEQDSNHKLSILRQAYIKKRDAKRVAKKLWLAHLDHHENQVKASKEAEN